MLQSSAQRYQSVQINTSTPGEVLLAVYDGLFKFLLRARHGFETGRRGEAGEAVSRAHAILSELMLALDPRHAPELCVNLTALYDFAMARLLEANRQQDASGIADVIRVLTPVREAFVIAVRGPGAGPSPVPETTMRLSEVR